MQMWTNFARTGDPALEEFDWPEYDLAGDTFVEIGPQGELTVKTGLEAAMEQTPLGCTPRKEVCSLPARPFFPLPTTRHLIWIMACAPVPAPNGESEPSAGSKSCVASPGYSGRFWPFWRFCGCWRSQRRSISAGSFLHVLCWHNSPAFSPSAACA